MQPTLTRDESKPQSWLPLLGNIFDKLFYPVALLVLAAFLYYLYSFYDHIVILLPYLLQGTVTTIGLSLVSLVLATIFGFLGALGRLSRFAPIRWLATIYVEVIRGTPILVQLLLWVFGISGALSQLGFDPHDLAYQVMSALQSNSLVPHEFNFIFYGIIGLSFNYGAYLTEVFRTGIESVQKGQTEAALSLGLLSRQIMRHIILPQAFRITIPPFTNYFITLIQDSALLATFGVIELELATSSSANAVQTNSNLKLFIYIFGGLFYLAICYPLSLLARYLEARLGRAY